MLATTEDLKFPPLEGMSGAHDSYDRRELFERGSVWPFPSTPLIMSC
jgi:hypothetical protein